MSPDFRIEGFGSIFLLHPLTSSAREWIKEHITKDAQTFGDAIVVEEQYVAEVVNGALSDGLQVHVWSYMHAKARAEVSR